MRDGTGIDLADRSGARARGRRSPTATRARSRWRRRCLARIAAREPEVGAFAALDPERVRAEARAQDKWQRDLRPLGRSTGCRSRSRTSSTPPTCRPKTARRSTPAAGRRRDAAVVARLRAAGAVILGKTVTTELGAMLPRGDAQPARSRPTRRAARRPGSAAAVAAGMAPLAIGTQTNGSVIRPASFCGIVGFKPTFGPIPRTGILPQATPLDTVGVFARSVADAALLVDALAGRDPSDPDSRDTPPPRLLDAALPAAGRAGASPSSGRRSWPSGGRRDEGGASRRSPRALGDACREEALPAIFADAIPAHTALAFAGIARHYGPYYDRGRDAAQRRRCARRSRPAATSRPSTISPRSTSARRSPPTSSALLDRYDAILTPAAPGEAPAGLGSTGNPAFNTLWSLCGMPAVSLPLLTGPNGLPVGVQLVGRRGDDARLLRTAAWLMHFGK